MESPVMNNTVRSVIILLVSTFVVLPVTLKVIVANRRSRPPGATSDWNRPFVEDAALVGTWETVDYVPNINDFKPDRKAFAGDLYLKGLTFRPNGTTSEACQWTQGYVWYPGDRAEGRYTIQDIDNVPYLFIEWITGDVLIRHEKPGYYVMKRKS